MCTLYIFDNDWASIICAPCIYLIITGLQLICAPCIYKNKKKFSTEHGARSTEQRSTEHDQFFIKKKKKKFLFNKKVVVLRAPCSVENFFYFCIYRVHILIEAQLSPNIYRVHILIEAQLSTNIYRVPI